MTSPRTVVIAGAGIGGLTAAIALAQRGFQVTVIEQAKRLVAIGAGIQLSPNASRLLIELGLGERLAPYVVAPQALNVINARTGRVLARATLGEAAAESYGAPYWVIHRGDLHTVLRETAEATPLIDLQLGVHAENFAAHDGGVMVNGKRDAQPVETPGAALIGADGLWSELRGRLGHRAEPRFAHHTAWRTILPADEVSPALRAPAVNLWLGRHAHLVHYPVRGGSFVNVVAILRDRWRETGWNAAGDRAELLARYPADRWQGAARELLAASSSWQKWALYDCHPLERWGSGPVTLLGDAAHPMLPYLAQGGAMAIEDAVVLAQCLAQAPDDVPAALRRYEDLRRQRTARAQLAARRNGTVYHLGGAGAFVRSLAFIAIRRTGLLRRYDWLYRWQPDA